MAKKYFWFKMHEDFFKRKEIKKLRKIAGGDTYTIIYQKMMLLSIRSEGKLLFDGVEETFAEEIALEIDEDAENVRVTLNFLTSYGLVDLVSDNEIILTEALKNIGTESDSAERMRLHRDRMKRLEIASHCDSSVTKSDTEIDIDKEIDLEKDKEHYMTCATKSMQIFVDMYYKHFGVNHRNISSDIDTGSLDDYDDETLRDIIQEHFNNNTKDRCNIEYFITVIDRYR